MNYDQLRQKDKIIERQIARNTERQDNKSTKKTLKVTHKTPRR